MLGFVRPLLSNSLALFSMEINTRIFKIRNISSSILPYWLVLVEKEMIKRWKKAQKEKKLECTISFLMVQKEAKSCGSAKNVKKHTEQMIK
jgi:hypothetical protein